MSFALLATDEAVNHAVRTEYHLEQGLFPFFEWHFFAARSITKRHRF
jgi:hypothetical protein